MRHSPLEGFKRQKSFIFRDMMVFNACSSLSPILTLVVTQQQQTCNVQVAILV